MTPAIEFVRKAGVVYRVHEFTHDPNAGSFAEEAAAALGVRPERVFKTLVIAVVDGASPLASAILPASCRLDMKAAAAALGARKADMASVAEAERATGYVHGGISPFAQKKRLPALVDEAAVALATVFVSGGRRGLQIELAPSDLIRLCAAKTAAISR